MTPKRESLFGGFSPPLISFLRQAAQQLRVPEGWQHAGGHGGLHWRRGRGVRDRQGSGQHVHYPEEGLGPRLYDGLLHRRKQKRKEENHLIWFVIVPSRVSNKHWLCVCVFLCLCVWVVSAGLQLGRVRGQDLHWPGEGTRLLCHRPGGGESARLQASSSLWL